MFDANFRAMSRQKFFAGENSRLIGRFGCFAGGVGRLFGISQPFADEN
jgi:hypothetical protein